MPNWYSFSSGLHWCHYIGSLHKSVTSKIISVGFTFKGEKLCSRKQVYVDVDIFNTLQSTNSPISVLNADVVTLSRASNKLNTGFSVEGCHGILNFPLSSGCWKAQQTLSTIAQWGCFEIYILHIKKIQQILTKLRVDCVGDLNFPIRRLLP